MSADISEWVTLNLPARIIVGESETTCQIVTLSTVGLVILPAMKGQPGLQFRIEFEPSHRATSVVIPAVLAREGAYHGNYAWQVQYGDPIPPETNAAILELLGYDVPPLEEPPAEEELMGGDDTLEADEAVEVATDDRGLRSYSNLLVDLPEMEVEEVEPAAMTDDGALHRDESDQDLWDQVDNHKLNKIFKAAIKQVDGQDPKKKKKKKTGWFGG